MHERTAGNLERLPDSERANRGMTFWELLAATVSQESVRERDRLMMAMLSPPGIDKGKPSSRTPGKLS
jgi:hypothetical protein